MRLCFYTDNFPYPLTEGGKVAQFYVLTQLAKLHKVHLVATLLPQDEHLVIEFKSHIPGINVHIVKKNITVEALNFKQKVKRKLLWHSRKMLQPKPATLPLNEHPYFIDPVAARGIEETQQIKDYLYTIQPDILQVDFTESADVILLAPQSAKTVLVVHDLRTAGVGQACDLSGHGSIYNAYIKKYVQIKEFAFYNLYDQVIVFSEVDRLRLVGNGVRNVAVSPFAINDKIVATTGTAAKSKLIFLGGDMHFPNLQAMQWFAPMAEKIQQQLGLQTFVVGKWKTQSTLAFKAYPALNFTGFVDDLNSLVQDAIMIVPLQIGSGIRTKILEAFYMQVPVVSTALGAEGIGAEAGKHYLAAETREQFFDAVNDLIQNAGLANRLASAAAEFVHDRFSATQVATMRETIYKTMLPG